MKTKSLTRAFLSTMMILVMMACLVPAMSRKADAKDERPVGSYKIVVDYNAADGGYNVQKVTYQPGGSYFTLPTAPVKEGKIFGGWLYNGTPHRPGSTIKITGDTTIKAIWKVTVKLEYIIRINGVTTDHDYSSVKVDFGKYTVKQVLAKMGWGDAFLKDSRLTSTITFSGWDYYTRIGGKAEAGQKVRGNGTIFILWDITLDD